MSFDLTLTGATLSMSSREIADICEARHNDVVATIERLLGNGVLRESRKTTRTYRPEKGGRPTEVYDLTKRDTLVVVSGYKDDVRAKIIDRWMELEAQAPAVPKTFREALLLAADQQEQIERQQAQIAADAPKVAALELISEKEGDLGIRDTGRELGIGQTRVREIILARRWACMQGRDIRPAHYGLEHGYVRMVARIYTDRVTGQEKVTDVFKITRKGITRLAEIVSGEGM